VQHSSLLNLMPREGSNRNPASLWSRDCMLAAVPFSQSNRRRMNGLLVRVPIS
jgi:hypothetical protein